jgi:uncharacterized membrane protein
MVPEVAFPVNDAVTPVGIPVANTKSIPVAPVVAIVIELISVFRHTIGLDEGTPAVLIGVTVIVPVAFTAPHPPVNGIE